jgi:twitching motility protein PilT
MSIRESLLNIIHHRTDISDLHVRAGIPILMRTPSGYLPVDNEHLTIDDIVEFVSMKSIGGDNWQDNMKLSGGKIDGVIDLTGSRLRYSIFETNGILHDVNIVMRIIRNNIIPIEELGNCYPVLKEFTTKGKGLVIITGATGSGKTTTMSSIIDRINATRSCHIMTIEDPIENVHTNKKAIISQREIKTNLDTFADGIEGAMRQRPDVIAVGELLDRETVEALFRAADSGHMVIATTHGRSAKDVINRMLGFFNSDEREQRRQVLASCLTGIISQSLVPSMNEESWVLASEVLVNTPTVKAIIAGGNFAQLASTMQQGKSAGMNLLGTDLMRLVIEKKISMKQASMAAYEDLPTSI